MKGWDCRIKGSKHAWQGEDSLVCGIDASNWAAGQQANYPIYIHSFLHQDILRLQGTLLVMGGWGLTLQRPYITYLGGYLFKLGRSGIIIIIIITDAINVR